MTWTPVKLAHYLKIPSRTLFFAQGLATILGALTQVGVTLWMLGNVEGICGDDQPNGFTCPNGLTVYSSSIIWGLIGPARLYSAGKIYSGLVRAHNTIFLRCSCSGSVLLTLTSEDALPFPREWWFSCHSSLLPARTNHAARAASLLLDRSHLSANYLLYMEEDEFRLCSQD